MSTPKTCHREEELLAALTRGPLNAELRAHIETCPECREAQQVWMYLSDLAAEPEKEITTSVAPGLIWWRAQLASRRRQAEQSVAAIKLVNKTALALAFALVWVAAVIWSPQSWEHLPFPILGAGIALLVLLFSTGSVLYAWARGKI